MYLDSCVLEASVHGKLVVGPRQRKVAHISRSRESRKEQAERHSHDLPLLTRPHLPTASQSFCPHDCITFHCHNLHDSLAS